MSNLTILYIGNDNILELDALTDDLTGDALNAAAVTVTLVDSDGDEVGGEVWPKTLAYVTNSNGVYRATLPHTLSMTSGGRYVAQVAVDAGPGLRAAWRIDCVARHRQ